MNYNEFIDELKDIPEIDSEIFTNIEEKLSQKERFTLVIKSIAAVIVIAVTVGSVFIHKPTSSNDEDLLLSSIYYDYEDEFDYNVLNGF